jgi:hypothetical protein
MLSPELGRAVFRIAFYVTFVSAVLLFALENGSAEFVVAALTFALGLIATIVVAILVRRQSRS